MFKRKNRTESFEKGIKVAGYTPVEYQNSKHWIKFQDEAEEKFTAIINKLNLDDLCFEILDPYIESESKKNEMFIKKQYSKHIHTIIHDAGILAGHFNKGEHHLKKLEQDRLRLEAQIDSLNNRHK